MLRNFVIIKKLSIFILPYIFLYGLYIQINGEVSPGGGFQAGVIFASMVIAFDLVSNQLKDNFSIDLLVGTATAGVLIYGLTGMVSILFGDHFLNYYSLYKDRLVAQHLGIFIIEIGVGLCVASTMCLIYFLMTSTARQE